MALKLLSCLCKWDCEVFVRMSSRRQESETPSPVELDKDRFEEQNVNGETGYSHLLFRRNEINNARFSGYRFK